ncbi:MAG: 7-carboxy-7-deazaguanine synthase QueE, partial [Sphingobacteriia bacterium]|nr:7-carboxy-7-deazaguanine synthase QueE [Sphingobacteriia bacterium]
TGGEPAMYNLQPLTDAFKSAGFECNIETSGAYPLTGDFDWVCLSPKKFKPAVDSVYASAHELKVVIYHPSDLAWAEGHAEKVNSNCLLYLQPEWLKAETLQPLIIEYIKQNPHWRLSLQTHKYLGIE